mgnify:CR=1 FL=1|jgi:hypothetical protein
MGNKFKQGMEKKIEITTQQSKEGTAEGDEKKERTEGESESEYGMMGGGGVGGPAFDALEKRVDDLSKGIGFAADGELPDWMKPKDPADEDPNLRLPGNLYCKYSSLKIKNVLYLEKLSKMLNKFLDEHQKTTE